jgi:glycosyltransferase involved in cell wall biosynthesis
LWTAHYQRDACAEAVSGIVPLDRQHVVRLGVDLSQFGGDVQAGRTLRATWGIRDEEIIVGTASPLRPRKRVLDFVQLIKTLASRNAKVVGVLAGGVVAGDESYRDLVQERVVESGLGRRLRWVGHLEPVEPFYQACDVVVSTSECETFGNSVCEAMACSKPVAAYRGGSVAEVIGDAGAVVETGDLEGLTSAVLRLLETPNVRQELGQRARRRVAEQFNPSHSYEQLSAIYRDLLAASGSASAERAQGRIRPCDVRITT